MLPAWRRQLKRDSDEELGLVLAAVEPAVLIEEVLRAPARVADLGRDVNDQRVHVDPEAEHKTCGRVLIQLRRSAGRNNARISQCGANVLFQALQGIPGDTAGDKRPRNGHRKSILRENRELPGVSAGGGSDTGARDYGVIAEPAVQGVRLDAEAERETQLNGRSHDVALSIARVVEAPAAHRIGK